MTLALFPPLGSDVMCFVKNSIITLSAPPCTTISTADRQLICVRIGVLMMTKTTNFVMLNDPLTT